MTFTDLNHPAAARDVGVETAQGASSEARSEQLREQARRLLADCRLVSAYDLDAVHAIGRLIDETRALAEDVLRLMPCDSRALTEALVHAHVTLTCLMEDVEDLEGVSSVRAHGERRVRRGTAVAVSHHRALSVRRRRA